MTTLSANSPRSVQLGDQAEYDVIASDIIYEGAAVGLVTASGHAQPLTSADRFVGFAIKKADNSDGAAAAINVTVRKKGVVQLSVTGAVITDVGQPVYAQDDDTFSFIKTSGVFIGFVKQYVSSGVALVEYDVDNFRDPWEGKVAQTLTTTLTLDIQDSGKVFFATADTTVTLPVTATAMQGVVIVNGGAYGIVEIVLDPNTADKIQGPNIAGADNTNLTNTKATANRGDFVEFNSGETNGPVITRMRGTWATA
jgi:hypothetical protein